MKNKIQHGHSNIEFDFYPECFHQYVKSEKSIIFQPPVLFHNKFSRAEWHPIPPKQFDIIIKEADKVEVLITNKMEYVKEAEKQNHILSLNPTAKIQMKTMQSNGKNFLRTYKTDFMETPQKLWPDMLP